MPSIEDDFKMVSAREKNVIVHNTYMLYRLVCLLSTKYKKAVLASIHFTYKIKPSSQFDVLQLENFSMGGLG